MTSMPPEPAAGASSSASTDQAHPWDPVAVTACVVGLVGIVVLGIVAAVLTGILAGQAGRRARAAGRSLENSYWLIGLAALDAVVWIVFHAVFDVPFFIG